MDQETTHNHCIPEFCTLGPALLIYPQNINYGLLVPDSWDSLRSRLRLWFSSLSASEPPGELVSHQLLRPNSRGFDPIHLRVRISDKFPSVADIDGPRTTFCETLL